MPAERILDGSRLAALRDTGLLDAPQDASLQRLNRIAAELLDVPMSLLTLVDEDRQFFAGQVGLAEPWASSRGTPLSHSFCQHVVGGDRPLAIADARADARVSGNLAIRDLGVVAYAGVPLRAGGETLGALCAIDSQPRPWSDHDLRVLEDLAALAADLIELRRSAASMPLRDPLTGLPGRTLFHELVGQALRRERRDAGTTAVLAVDLVGFRLVNEALGHAVGDELLVEVARRMGADLRGRDAICRTDADHFLILCESVSGETEAVRIAARLRALVGVRPYRLVGRVQRIESRIGVALATASERPDDPEELVRCAIGALATANDDGKEVGSRPRPDVRADAARRLQLRNDLPGAHDRGEMQLVYQPLVELDSHRVAGLEALLRWEHPELGVVPPLDFVPLAETSGAIVALGDWILDRACHDLARWRLDCAAPGLTVAVNVAPIQLRVADFTTKVAATLERAGLPGDALTIELTERTFLDDRRAHHDTLASLRAIGVEIALDDFGTGYSALSCLARFPLDTIKIDRVFTADIDTRSQAAALVRGILAMADGLGLRTIAEGVETDAQRLTLRTLGCPLGQGYLLGEPIPAAEVARRLLTPAPGHARPLASAAPATAA